MEISTTSFCPKCGWKPSSYTYEGHEFDSPPQKCHQCKTALKKKLVLRR